MDKIDKFIQKLSRKDQDKIKHIINQILKGEIDNLDVKKLKSYSNVFRVRTEDARVVFRKEAGIVRIVSVDKRSDTLYKKL